MDDIFIVVNDDLPYSMREALSEGWKVKSVTSTASYPNPNKHPQSDGRVYTIVVLTDE